MTEKRKSTAIGLPPLPPRKLYAEADPGQGSRSPPAQAAKATRRAKASKALNDATKATRKSQRRKASV